MLENRTDCSDTLRAISSCKNQSKNQIYWVAIQKRGVLTKLMITNRDNRHGEHINVDI